MENVTGSPRAAVAALLTALNARAAGLWRLEGDRLEQVAFVPAPDLPNAVATEFAALTLSVALAQTSLAIVQAACAGALVVSRAAELPADVGSGLWLRAFGAARSVAVPLVDPEGSVSGVLSVALLDAHQPDDEVVAALLRSGLDADRSPPHNG